MDSRSTLRIPVTPLRFPQRTPGRIGGFRPDAVMLNEATFKPFDQTSDTPILI